MILNITRLREDYKSIYKKNWHTAEKINLLIEVTKIEMSKLLVGGGLDFGKTLPTLKSLYWKIGAKWKALDPSLKNRPLLFLTEQDVSAISY